MAQQLRTIGKAGSLDDLLFSGVDETLRHVFKEAGAKVIYDYLWSRCGLKREEISEKPEVFSACLKRLLSSGAPVIEKVILKNLYNKLQLEFQEKEGNEFSDYMKELSRNAVVKV